MGRIMAIDYGTKRVGIAVTDPNKIIATALDTVHSKDIIDYLKKYFISQEVEMVVVAHRWKFFKIKSQLARLAHGSCNLLDYLLNYFFTPFH